jgi:hypothetical protein
MNRWVVLYALLRIRKSLRLENIQESLQARMPGSNSENVGEVLWWFMQQYCGTLCYWSHYYPSWPNYCKGVHGQVG